MAKNRLTGALALLTVALLYGGIARAQGITTYAAIIGINESDFGGESEPGVALGVAVLRNANASGVQLGGAFEYLQKVSSGPIRFFDSSIGEVVPLGTGRVDLRYVHGVMDIRYAVLLGSVQIAPYGGAGISLLLSQSVNLEDETNYPDTLGWYSGLDADLLFGIAVSYARCLVDIQYSSGLGDLGKGSNGMEGEGGLRTFSDESGSMDTLRIAVGYLF